MNISFQIIVCNIKSARTALGLASEEAAERAGMSAFYFAQIERGEHQISTKQLAQIADALNTSVHALLRGSVLDAENYPAMFESNDPQAKEYGEYATSPQSFRSAGFLYVSDYFSSSSTSTSA